MKKLLFIIFTLSISGCDFLNSDQDSGSVLIRIANTSPVDFTSIYVSFPGAEHTFGTTKSGRRSQYQKFDQAYRYGYIEIKTGSNSYVLQPIDYVGEQPLKNGRYTFELDLQDDSVTLNATRD